MLFNRNKVKELKSGEPLYTIIEIDDRLEDCRSAGVEMETYYRIRNNMTGKKIWINKRFASEYGL